MTLRRNALGIIALLLVFTGTGCGLVGDKDRIPMARIGEREITRGDLRMALRKLPPEEKPVIGTKGDVRAALNDYIDSELKAMEAERLSTAGEISVDPQRAEQIFFAQNPDVMDVRGVTDVNTLPVAITPIELENLKQTIKDGIARTERDMLRDEAIRHLVLQAYETGRFEISDAEWEREYRIQKNILFHPPRATIRALAIPAIDDSAARVAAEFRERVDRGEDFDAVFNAFVEEGKGSVIDTEMVYEPGADHLRTFWEAVTSATSGSLFGPVNIAGRVVTIPDELGNPQQQRTPPAFLVGRVEEYVEPVQKTLEEAKPDLAASVLFVRVIQELRQRYDVEIFEKNLYSPDVGTSGGAGPVRQQDPQGAAAAQQ